MAVVPDWLAYLLATGVLLGLLARFLDYADRLDEISTRERRATDLAGVALLVVFYLQWKGFVPVLVAPIPLVTPAVLLFVYPEIRGPVA